MTEADWLTGTDLNAHVRFVADRLSTRRQRLLAVGFCRVIEPIFRFADLDGAFTVLEQYADGLMTETKAEKTRQRYREIAQESYALFLASVDHGPEPDWRASARAELAWVLAYAFNYSPVPLDQISTRVVATACCEGAGWRPALVGEHRPDGGGTAEHALAPRRVVWEVVGNPFRPTAFKAEWRTDTAVALARQMYQSREFGAMPILADALQDAGCDDDDVLNHCRDTTIEHIRGCWVLDLILPDDR